MIAKSWILWKLRSFRAGLNSIDVEAEDLAELTRWHRNFMAFLSQLYPNGSDLETASSEVLAHAGQQYDMATDRTQSPTRLDYKSKYCDEFLGILDELRSTVTDQGVPPNFKPPTWHAQVNRFLSTAAVLLLLTIPTKCYLANRASAERATEEAQEVQNDAIVAISDFNRLLGTFDTHFQNIAFDSAVNSLRQQVGFESGMYITGMIEFAKSARRRRDASIDSAIVRLEQLGVDTDTLRFSKRLPIRIGQALKGRAQALELDADIVNSVVRCDSL